MVTTRGDIDSFQREGEEIPVSVAQPGREGGGTPPIKFYNFEKIPPTNYLEEENLYSFIYSYILSPIPYYFI